MSLQKLRERTTLGLVLGIFAVVVININLFSFRLDLTSGGAYSISQATKGVVAQAKENITVTYYLSKKLKSYYPVTESLADFLDEYASASGGKVKVRVVDPQDTGEVGDMQRLGIVGNQIDVVEESQQTQAIVFSGILIQYMDRQEVMPQVQALETLEYDLTSRINKLITQKTKTVALLIGDSSKTLDNSFRSLSNEFYKSVTFKTVSPNEPIGNDVSVLIVSGTKNIDAAEAYRIDQYLMSGGKLLLAADGVWVDISSQSQPVVKADNNPLLKSLESWGIKVDSTLVLDNSNNKVQYNTPQGATIGAYALFPKILAKNMNRSHAVTNRSSGLNLLWTSPLEDLKKAGLKVEPLAMTTDKSWIMKDNLTIDPGRSMMSSQAPDADPKARPVVFAVSGSFSSSFDPAALPPEVKAIAGTIPFQAKSPDTRIIVVGSSNWLTDFVATVLSNTQFFGADPMANLQFVDAATDWLAQDDALLSIKTRTYREKSLTILQDTQVRQGAAFSLSFVSLLVIPLLIVGLGIFRFLRRRSREQKGS